MLCFLAVGGADYLLDGRFGLGKEFEKGILTCGRLLLVMAGFTQSQLDQFLHSLRKKGGGPVALKAVVTPANQGWDSVTLFREILQEHQAFEAGRQAKT